MSTLELWLEWITATSLERELRLRNLLWWLTHTGQTLPLEPQWSSYERFAA